MAKTCEIVYRGVDEKGQRLPRLERFGKMPLLRTSRLPGCLARKVEFGLGIWIARDEIVSNLVSKKPLETALAVITGACAAGVLGTAYVLSR